MCSGKGIGHWITHSPITPLDSSAASRFANVRLPSEPRRVSSAVLHAHSGIAQPLVRRNREYAMNPENRTCNDQDDDKTRGTACSGMFQKR
jgi:hypothetical protein